MGQKGKMRRGKNRGGWEKGSKVQVEIYYGPDVIGIKHGGGKGWRNESKKMMISAGGGVAPSGVSLEHKEGRVAFYGQPRGNLARNFRKGGKGVD